MFERFTDRARRVVVLAQEEARMLDHGYIGTEHLLLGPDRRGRGRGGAGAAEPSRSAWTRSGEQVTEIIGRGSGRRPAISRSPRAPRRCSSSRCARRSSSAHNYIGTEHILLGLVREGEGVAAQVLVKLGAEPEPGAGHRCSS